MSSTYINTQHNAGFAKRVLKTLAVIYFLGLLLSIFYTWFLTKDRFITSATFKISRQDASSGVEPGIAQLTLPGMADSGAMDSQVTIGYINSADLLLDLEKQFNLVEHYSSPKIDFIFRMDPEDLLEERLEYYRKRITAHFDINTGLTTISVDTFEPKLALEIATVILQRAEAFVNTINQDVADQQLVFIRSEVDRASEKVDEIHRELLELQNRHKFISPSEEITANLAAVQQIKLERLRTDGELASLLRDSPESPMIESLQSRLRSLNELIDKEAAKLSGSERDRLNQILMKFQEIELKLETATRLRTAAEMMFEKNRTDAAARSRFFSVIQMPYLPEDVALPLRGYSSVSIIFIGLLLFFIMRALTGSIFERA